MRASRHLPGTRVVEGVPHFRPPWPRLEAGEVTVTGLAGSRTLTAAQAGGRGADCTNHPCWCFRTQRSASAHARAYMIYYIYLDAHTHQDFNFGALVAHVLNAHRLEPLPRKVFRSSSQPSKLKDRKLCAQCLLKWLCWAGPSQRQAQRAGR